MKNLFLALLFNLITFTSFSQDDFNGWWESKTSKYITMIYTGEYGVAEVVNYNPFNEHVIEEKILKRTKKTFQILSKKINKPKKVNFSKDLYLVYENEIVKKIKFTIFTSNYGKLLKFNFFFKE